MATLRVNISTERAYLSDLGRAFGGALLFNIPQLMTMEMWEQGVSMDPWRLLIFMFAGLPLLFGIAFYAGFSVRRGFLNDLLDTAVALAVGFSTAGALLSLFGVIDWDRPPNDVVGMVALQAIPGAMGALLARRQLSSSGPPDAKEETSTYPGELFLMAAGALFLALNVAPTEEMILISYMASPYHMIGLVVVSVALLHFIVFKAGFAGQEDADKPFRAFLHFTLPGYMIALAVSTFTLFIFGRLEGHWAPGAVQAAVVLAFPGSIGAAAARLLV